MSDPAFDLWMNLELACMTLAFIALPVFWLIVLGEWVFQRRMRRMD